jgi:peptidoglycan-N-acetylglucosamine deacetylase
MSALSASVAPAEVVHGGTVSRTVLDTRSGLGKLAAAVAVLFAVVACAGDEPRPGAQPGATAADRAGVEASATPAAAAPAPGASPSATPGAPASPAVTGSSPSSRPATSGPPASTSRAPEGGFTVRPPSGGHGPAESIKRTRGTEVALTFDDGPDPVNTPAILQVLRENGVKATFCMVGFRVRDRPDLVRQIHADGHTLCNHSWQHLFDLAKKDAEYLDWDLRHTNEMIRSIVGADVPIKYFRAPGGNFTPSLVAKAKELGMESIYWDVDPRDWDHKGDSSRQAHIARVVSQVKAGIRQGSIILSHDNGQPDTIVAYRQLIPWMKQYFTLERLPT